MSRGLSHSGLSMSAELSLSDPGELAVTFMSYSLRSSADATLRQGSGECARGPGGKCP